ncbi:unnamed protein product [Lasius platythorax]|uniref:Uncharacterized protein n=1 Tax=Lasius platythorax TaxID=488582 RepID=A0AAV2NS58_9HYME
MANRGPFPKGRPQKKHSCGLTTGVYTCYALLRPQHISLQQSRKLIHLLIGLLFTEKSEYIEPSRPEQNGSAASSLIDDRLGPLTS